MCWDLNWTDSWESDSYSNISAWSQSWWWLPLQEWRGEEEQYSIYEALEEWESERKGIHCWVIASTASLISFLPVLMLWTILRLAEGVAGVAGVAGVEGVVSEDSVGLRGVVELLVESSSFGVVALFPLLIYNCWVISMHNRTFTARGIIPINFFSSDVSKPINVLLQLQPGHNQNHVAVFPGPFFFRSWVVHSGHSKHFGHL